MSADDYMMQYIDTRQCWNELSYSSQERYIIYCFIAGQRLWFKYDIGDTKHYAWDSRIFVVWKFDVGVTFMFELRCVKHKTNTQRKVFGSWRHKSNAWIYYTDRSDVSWTSIIDIDIVIVGNIDDVIVWTCFTCLSLLIHTMAAHAHRNKVRLSSQYFIENT